MEMHGNKGNGNSVASSTMVVFGEHAEAARVQQLRNVASKSSSYFQLASYWTKSDWPTANKSSNC